MPSLNNIQGARFPKVEVHVELNYFLSADFLFGAAVFFWGDGAVDFTAGFFLVGFAGLISALGDLDPAGLSDFF